jgi:hypothetical protein
MANPLQNTMHEHVILFWLLGQIGIITTGNRNNNRSHIINAAGKQTLIKALLSLPIIKYSLQVTFASVNTTNLLSS